MPRVTTPLLAISTWLDGENPGAGSQTVLAGNTGLNANWLILDQAVGTEHNANGTHKANVIDGPTLKTTAFDGATLELVGAPLKAQIKDLGVASGKLAANSVIAGKIATGGVSAAAQFAAGVVDAAALASNAVTTVKILDANVTGAKIVNNTVSMAKLEPKIYLAAVSQSGAGAPSATVISNSLSGTPTWARLSAGAYTITLTNEWTANKTFFIVSPGGYGSGFAQPVLNRTDISTLTVNTYNGATVLQDGWFVMIMILVFP